MFNIFGRCVLSQGFRYRRIRGQHRATANPLRPSLTHSDEAILGFFRVCSKKARVHLASGLSLCKTPEIENKKKAFAHPPHPVIMSYPEQLLLGQLLAPPPHGSEEESVAVVAVAAVAAALVVGRRRARVRLSYFSPVSAY